MKSRKECMDDLEDAAKKRRDYLAKVERERRAGQMGCSSLHINTPKTLPNVITSNKSYISGDPKKAVKAMFGKRDTNGKQYVPYSPQYGAKPPTLLDMVDYFGRIDGSIEWLENHMKDHDMNVEDVKTAIRFIRHDFDILHEGFVLPDGVNPNSINMTSLCECYSEHNT